MNNKDLELPVLMYHGVTSPTSPSPENRETGADLYDVSAVNFRAQIKWLHDNGKKPVITFDDGEMNNFTEAFPVLKEFGFTAYFFVIIKRVGKKGYMGWAELQKMVEGGMTIGSHGLTHEILTNLQESQMEEELRASKSNLEINLNTTIEDLSIPRGFCNDKILQAAYEKGYKNIFISDRPCHVKLKCYNRVAVKGSWSIKRFAQAMAGETPLRESIGTFFKRSAKTILREAGYNWVRSGIIRLLK